MQRRLISLYERHCPDALRRAIPGSIKAAVLGSLYRATRHPDLGFRHVRQLLAMGKGVQAAALYASPGAGVDALADPLFDATITADGATGIHAEFGYRGLWLGGNAPATDWVEIRLDGAALRRERLRGKSSFRYILGREALALFPVESRLDVVSDRGDVIGAWRVVMPQGRGGLTVEVNRRGPLEKKGGLRPNAEELATRQVEYLSLYARVRAAFEDAFGKPVFILYGTLLGQHRSGDFIPGDDDFDVGYVSDKGTFSAVRDEAIEMIEALVARGFTVALNAEGKPFRIRDDAAAPDIWLDNRPVFCPGDGQVWLHKHARLALDMDDFRRLDAAKMGGAEILKPCNTEAFLAAYYGAGWRVPDPGFSNATKGVDPKITEGLAQVNLTHSQQKQLAARITARDLPGRFEPLALQKLYPLATE